MYIHIGPKGPILCSACGSPRAIKPVNEPDVILRCADCGHEKREPTRDKRWDDLFNRTFGTGTSAGKIDENPTF